MTAQWLILADDLTGAADCAIAFAKRGHHTNVRWKGMPAGTSEAVLSYDTDSRGLSAPEAAARHADVLAGLHRPGACFFKKIDSTLRGQPMAELAATLAHFRVQRGGAFGILAPAFPGTGRTTSGGRIQVHGEPLEETEVWRRDRTYVSAHLPSVLESSGFAGAMIGLDIVRAGAGALRDALVAASCHAEVVVCDAVSDEDLSAIAAATCGPGAAELPPGLFWIGAGGLADAIAKTLDADVAAPPALEHGGGGTLVVVGSLAQASRAAATVLAADTSVRHILIDPAQALAGRDTVSLGASIAAGLRAGEDILVEVTMGPEPDLTRGPAIADALGRLLAPAARHAGGLVATGGETSAALLAHCRIDGLRLVDEIEPGVSLGLTLGAFDVPIITKAGAFGDEGTLTRAVRRLRAIYRQGTIA